MLDAFGVQIANTDRHLFNVALFPEQGGYSLAPAFDQLPMAYAPPASGHLRMTAVEAPVPTVNTLEVWDEAMGLTREFWRRTAELPLTDSMREIAATHLARMNHP